MCALDGLRALAISIEEILLQKKKEVQKGKKNGAGLDRANFVDGLEETS